MVAYIILGIVSFFSSFIIGGLIGLAVGFGEGYLQGLKDKENETN